ncbi:ArsR/SmtB family transcription factor [Corynebacterium pseudopelargi]|uniref:HTH-type transcriptional repressor SmtB n=1 Tax=Corynebacterium pseudopelargi TaxID=2080757 RepID=A0A3G6IVW9_9CORY|nr:metalloregulator ArsR/SmtB family transcription factor [Corynebacterium pseudopelargi]AZA08808.1 HTH-type transcriptional repressor SmtB [Corynebacterium pseudopelargi]
MDNQPQLASFTSHALDPVELQQNPGIQSAELLDQARDFSRTAQIFGALDSPIRLRILHLLQQRDHFVHEIVALLGASQPLVSQHLRVLKEAGLVSAERKGRQMTYHLVDTSVTEIADMAEALIERLDRRLLQRVH